MIIGMIYMSDLLENIRPILPILFKVGNLSELYEETSFSLPKISKIMKSLKEKKLVHGPYFPSFPAIGLGIDLSMEKPATSDLILGGWRTNVGKYYMYFVPARESGVRKIVYYADAGRSIIREMELKTDESVWIDYYDFLIITSASLRGNLERTILSKMVPNLDRRISRLKKTILKKRWVPTGRGMEGGFLLRSSEPLFLSPFSISFVKEGVVYTITPMEAAPLLRNAKFDTVEVIKSVTPLKFELRFNTWRELVEGNR